MNQQRFESIVVHRAQPDQDIRFDLNAPDLVSVQLHDDIDEITRHPDFLGAHTFSFVGVTYFLNGKEFSRKTFRGAKRAARSREYLLNGCAVCPECGSTALDKWEVIVDSRPVKCNDCSSNWVEMLSVVSLKSFHSGAVDDEEQGS